MKTRSDRRRAFSLVEVIVAIGVLAATVVGVLALLVPALRGVRDSTDRRVAAQLASAVERELGTHARSGFADFDAFVASTAMPLRLVATADGGRIERETATALAANEQFHLVEISRTTRPAAAAGQGFVGLQIRIAWPYRGGAVRPADRFEFSTVTVVTP